MGFSSQAGQVAFMTQASPDTFPVAFDANNTAMKLRSGSLGPNRDLLITDPEIGGGRDVVDAYLGAVHWSGDLEYYVRMEGITTLLKAAMGQASSVTTTGATVHTITPKDSATLPFLAIQESIGGAATHLECYNYTDGVVNTLHFEADANGFLMGTAGVIARKQVAGITPTLTPMWDDSFLTVGTNITVTYNGVTLPAKSFAWDLNNNFSDDDYRLGSFYLGDLTAMRREITGTVHIRPQDSDLWRQAVYGTTAATSPGGLTTKNQLIVTCTTYEDIVGATPAGTKEVLTLTMPKVALEPFAFGPSGDDVIESDITWRALRPAVATPAATVTVRSGADTIA